MFRLRNRAIFNSSIYAVGGTESVVSLSGEYYRLHTFNYNSTTPTQYLTVYRGGQVDYLVVGGGGGWNGTETVSNGAGGGGGQVKQGTINLPVGTTTVVIGSGGVVGKMGAKSVLATTTASITCFPGGAAYKKLMPDSTYADIGGTSGSGNLGGNEKYPSGGGGGGDAAPGSLYYGGSGTSSNITGTQKYYGGGGNGVNQYDNGPRLPISLGAEVDDYGAGGTRYYTNKGSGNPGVVMIRYRSNVFAASANYIQATGGTELVYTSGGVQYKSHTFTNNISVEYFTVTACPLAAQVSCLLVGGGGNGGSNSGGMGGGGGAGGVLLVGDIPVTTFTYSVDVGAGGNGYDGVGGGVSGESSIAFGNVAIGGGGGGYTEVGKPGGSGGGGGESKAGGTGATGQGNAGGTGSGDRRGGGGGAAAAGGSGASCPSSSDGYASMKGGNGRQITFGGVTRYYGAGGGGGSRGCSTYARGGTGGGGQGGWSSGAPTAGSGYGAGGGGGGYGVSGGDGMPGYQGIVIIVYPWQPG